MPKKIEKKSALDMVGWIESLPEGGRSWGKGVIGSVMALESEAAEVDKEIEKLSEQASALKEKAASRRSTALKMARRAEKDVENFFTADEIKAAKPAPEAEAGTAS
jgi:hypothetical protein